ncbi:MAG: helix-turn-helix transcriptional regulator [Oscillospiraceae bacterium]|nr:helix-turn-helix transcriptional regulator [Oscillospiraceae bacterium]
MPKITLKAARVNANLTQAEAAAKLGVAVSTLKNWETGKTFPNKPKIDRLCEVYGITFDVLFFG